MKKVFSVLLSFLLLCVLLSGCNGNTAADEKGNSSVQLSNTEQEGEHVIRLVTDLGKNAKFWTDIEDDTAGAQNAIEQALTFIGDLPAGYKVTVEVLPTNEADYQSRLTNLRTEIMAGKGPDIFVLCTDDYGKMYTQKRLFPNPQKAMADGLFLSLDDYLANARYMELDKMNPTVIQAGRYENTQMVLPIRYSYGAAKINANLPDPESGWNEVMSGNDETMKNIYAAAANAYFHNIFPNTVDYSSEALTFSEDALYNALAMALQNYDYPEDPSAEDAVIGFQVKGENPEIPTSLVWNKEAKGNVSYIPLRNTDGGVSVGVTSYIAINRNTPYPEEAFHVVDVIMSKKFQSGERFWPNEGYSGTASALPVFSWSTGVSVYDDLMQKSQPLNYENYIEDEMFPVYCEMRDRITDARIITNIDKALDDLLFAVQREEIRPGDDLKKRVSESYARMTQMIGEM